MKYTKNTLRATVWEWGMWEGREADGLFCCEHTEAGRPGKMQQQPLQMTPWETGVATHNTNFTAWTLWWEPDSHLHCQRKGYFWKMGLSPWFNSLTNPRKRGLSPGEAVWFRLRLHFSLDLLSFSFLTFTQTHIHMCTRSDKFHFNFIMEWSTEEARRSENVSWKRFMFDIHWTKQAQPWFPYGRGTPHFNASHWINWRFLWKTRAFVSSIQ